RPRASKRDTGWENAPLKKIRCCVVEMEPFGKIRSWTPYGRSACNSKSEHSTAHLYRRNRSANYLLRTNGSSTWSDRHRWIPWSISYPLVWSILSKTELLDALQ